MVYSGSNLTAVNLLLETYGIEFMHSSYSGEMSIGAKKDKYYLRVESGAVISKFP